MLQMFFSEKPTSNVSDSQLERSSSYTSTLSPTVTDKLNHTGSSGEVKGTTKPYMYALLRFCPSFLFFFFILFSLLLIIQHLGEDFQGKKILKYFSTEVTLRFFSIS